MSNLNYNYNYWNYWGVYNPSSQLYGDQKVIFDGYNKIIIVAEGVTQLDFRVDVYSAWKEWLFDPNQTNLKWAEALSVTGGDPLPGNRNLGTTYFLENGWKMRTWEGNHELTVTGNVFSRDGGSIFVPTLNPWTITINLNTSTLVETILPEISLGTPDIDAISASVWAEVLSGIDAGTRLIQLATLINNLQTSVDAANTTLTATEVWDYIIDSAKNQSAGEKLKKVPTKTNTLSLT